MKILEVTPTYPPAWFYGGITRVVYEITKELSKKGHALEVWTSDAFDPHSRIKSVDVSTVETGAKIRYFKNLSFPLTRMLNIHITLGMVASAKKELRDFDVVHLHGARIFQNIAVYPYAKKYNVPYVFQAHGSLPRIVAKQSLKWIYDVFFGYRLLKDASNVIALSQMEAEQYRGMGVPEEKIEVIPNGIDLSEYGDLPPKGGFKKRFGIEEDEKIVLYLGRLHRGKGIGFLIKAYSCLLNSTNIHNTSLVIAGPDDGYLREAKSLVSSHRLSGNVLFTGMLSEKDKTSAYVDSSVLINAEPSNVFGLVPLEAAACRTPVIVSDKNAISEPVLKGGFGFPVKYGDVAELAETMRKMLSNKDLLRQMGREGREFTFRNYNWANIITKLEKVYEEAVTGAK